MYSSRPWTAGSTWRVLDAGFSGRPVGIYTRHLHLPGPISSRRRIGLSTALRPRHHHPSLLNHDAIEPYDIAYMHMYTHLHSYTHPRMHIRRTSRKPKNAFPHHGVPVTTSEWQADGTVAPQPAQKDTGAGSEPWLSSLIVMSLAYRTELVRPNPTTAPPSDTSERDLTRASLPNRQTQTLEMLPNGMNRLLSRPPQPQEGKQKGRRIHVPTVSKFPNLRNPAWFGQKPPVKLPPPLMGVHPPSSTSHRRSVDGPESGSPRSLLAP